MFFEILKNTLLRVLGYFFFKFREIPPAALFER
jgi:hypothetical protein